MRRRQQHDHPQEANGFPRRTLGRVAEVNGIEDGTWMRGSAARKLTGLSTAVLTRWEELGFISAFQAAPGTPRLYLRQELEVVAGLRTDAPPKLGDVRRHVAQREAQRTAGGPQ